MKNIENVINRLTELTVEKKILWVTEWDWDRGGYVFTNNVWIGKKDRVSWFEVRRNLISKSYELYYLSAYWSSEENRPKERVVFISSLKGVKGLYNIILDTVNVEDL